VFVLRRLFLTTNLFEVMLFIVVFNLIVLLVYIILYTLYYVCKSSEFVYIIFFV